MKTDTWGVRGLLIGGAWLVAACSDPAAGSQDAELGAAWTWVAPRTCTAHEATDSTVATFEGTEPLWSVKTVVDEQRLFLALEDGDGEHVDIVSAPLSCQKPIVLSRRKATISAGFAYEDGSLYFVESNRLLALSVTTGAVRTVADTAPGTGDAGRGAQIAVRRGVVYVADIDGSVWQVPAKGGDPVTLASSGDAPSAIALDDHAVYWASVAATTLDEVQHQLGKVQTVPLAGGTVTVIAADQEDPDSLVVSGSTLYWANAGTFGVDAPADPGQIVAADLSAESRTILADEDSSPDSLLRAGDALYWKDGAAAVPNSIVKLSLDRRTPMTLSAATPGKTYFSNLVASNDALYWLSLEQTRAESVHNVTSLIRWVLPAP